MATKSIAVLGAGPIGLEAALRAVAGGHDVTVLERGEVGRNLRRWGHVRMFSPWRLNHSAAGARLLAENGVALPGAEDYLTGAEHVAAYLEPLARSAPLAGRIREHTRVVQVGRERLGKSAPLGAARRRHPLRLLVAGPAGEERIRADVVLDCSGTYDRPNWMGNGNVPAPGERGLGERIAYHLEDVAGAARDRYAGRRVLLVGAGHSAITALEQLLELPRTRVVWVFRGAGDAPYRVIEADPLPARQRLALLGNALAAGADASVDVRRGCAVEAACGNGGAIRVTLSGPRADESEVEVDRVLALVGYGPDRSIYRELQVHECYATLGPMRLAGRLLAGESSDCLAQTSAGADELVNPEPDFFILGAKSYGRNPDFLIRLGLDQIRDVFTLVEDGPGGDAAAAPDPAGKPLSKEC